MSYIKKGGRGGRRAGAGRPAGDSRLYTFRAPGKMAEVIDCQENKTEFIRNCIRKAIRSEAPDSTRRQDITDEAADSTRRRNASAHADSGTPSSGGLPANPSGISGQVFPAASVRGLHLPFFDFGIRAGFPIPLDNDEKAQDIELLRMLCPHPEASYLIRVAGNSMIDAGIDDGDIIIVDKSHRNPAPSEVAVCELNGEYTLKRFEKDGDGCGWLIPANPDYPRIRITPDDSFSVWGTVTYIIHKPRL